MADPFHANDVIGNPSSRNDPLGSEFALAVALAFYAAGCVLLVLTGPTLGVLHAFAAFAVIAAVAALNQLLPVLTHAPNARAGIVFTIASAFAIGFSLLIAGFYGAHSFGAAAVVLATSAAFWAGWSVLRLFQGRDERRTRALAFFALAAFLAAAGLGAAMAGALGDLWALPIFALAPIHALLAIGGFASILIITISYRFVPMFAVAHANAYGSWGTAWLAALGVLVAAASFERSPIGLRIGLIALVAASVGIGISHLKTLSSRLRARLDVSLRYGQFAWTFGIFASASALAGTWQPRMFPAALVLAILGWLSITIFGYAYKIVGFLTWQGAKTRMPNARLPALGNAVDLPLAYAALGLMTTGALVAAACTFVESSLARVGYDIYALGGIAAVVAIARLATRYLFASEGARG